MPYRDPDKQREYKREWARMNRAGDRGTPNGTPIPFPFRLRTAQDVLRLLEEFVALVREEKSATTLEKARVVGYLAGVSLKAIEVTDLSARLERLEEALEQQAALRRAR